MLKGQIYRTYDFIMLLADLLASQLAQPVIAGGAVGRLQTGDYERHFRGSAEGLREEFWECWAENLDGWSSNFIKYDVVCRL